MNREKPDNEQLLDHEYDGIRELDNPLPGWWLMTFYVTIVFAVIYFSYYQLLGGPTSDEQLANEMSEIKAERAEAQKKEAEEELSEHEFRTLVLNKKVIEKGKKTFSEKCTACHGEKGQGVIGPNLTDDYWIHGNGDMGSILNVVKQGVPDKGMPAWKGVISPDEMKSVTAYIYSLHGTDPEGAKPPQGKKVEYK